MTADLNCTEVITVNLAPMSFKNYTWPHNPSTFEVTNRRVLASYKIPFGKTLIRDMGRSFRVFRGEGEFAGENAYDSFKELEEIFYEGTSGLLSHPVWKQTRAYFAELSLFQEPRQDYVRYTFEFWEDEGIQSGVSVVNGDRPGTGTSGGRGGGTYTVKSGDTMWSIAAAQNMTVWELMEKNGHIKNPNLIYPGDTIYI